MTIAPDLLYVTVCRGGRCTLDSLLESCRTWAEHGSCQSRACLEHLEQLFALEQTGLGHVQLLSERYPDHAATYRRQHDATMRAELLRWAAEADDNECREVSL